VNINFLSCARYPTEKAYGVTIGNTMLSLKKLGIENSVITWGKLCLDEYGNSLMTLEQNPVRIPILVYGASFRPVAKTAYLINQLIFSMYFAKSKNVFEDKTIFWTREPLTLLMHSMLKKDSHYLIELHHSISRAACLVIKLLAMRNFVQILAITDESARSFSCIFKDIKVKSLAMGVPEAFINIRRDNDKKEFVVGYLGKGVSNGHDNDLVEIVYACKEIQSEKNIKFVFIGLENEYKEKLQKTISSLHIDPGVISFVDHVEHSQVPGELAKLDVGILPYPESDYNSERFPLKLLEYSAVGLPIIASDTKAHRQLLNESFTTFYNKGDSHALAVGILRIEKDIERISCMSENAREFSRKFTYDERARGLLQFLKAI
jgi:glycosyltransferase involved in cell wall biosynthesis